jgi:futalosine hydrolase
MAIGDVVVGESEVYGDVGFELPQEPWFQPITGAAFCSAFYRRELTLTPYVAPEEAPTGYAVHRARGCTVSCCTGTAATGRLRAGVFGAGFETMEGAAVAQVGVLTSTPVAEVRAISNMASDRDMRPENIALALANLRDYLRRCRVR